MDRLLNFSSHFVLSSGTVPIDVPRCLVALIYRPDQEKKEYLLPKGRKAVGETLEHAATRVTLQECGYNCCLLGHNLSTNARGLDDPRHTEPIAVQQHVIAGCREILFWYVSEMDSSSVFTGFTQEDYSAVWVPLGLAASKCSFADDRRIVEKALEAVFGPVSKVADKI